MNMMTLKSIKVHIQRLGTPRFTASDYVNSVVRNVSYRPHQQDDILGVSYRIASLVSESLKFKRIFKCSSLNSTGIK
jgi:hypothetical protein